MTTAGHTGDALARLRSNREVLLNRRQRIASLKEMYRESIKIEGYEYHEDQIPKEVVEKIKNKIRERIRKKRIRSTVLSVTLTILLISIIVLLTAKYVEI